MPWTPSLPLVPHLPSPTSCSRAGQPIQLWLLPQALTAKRLDRPVASTKGRVRWAAVLNLLVGAGCARAFMSILAWDPYLNNFL